MPEPHPAQGCRTAWTGWALCRARTNIVPKPRDSASDAGLADMYLASPAQPRISIGLGTTVARVLPAERPETCSRPPGVRRLRSAFGLVRRSRRAADAEGAPAAGRRILHPARRHTSAFLAFDASPPAPVTRPLRRRTPVRTLASPFRGRRAGTSGGSSLVRKFISALVGRGRLKIEDGGQRTEDGLGADGGRDRVGNAIPTYGGPARPSLPTAKPRSTSLCRPHDPSASCHLSMPSGRLGADRLLSNCHPPCIY